MPTSFQNSPYFICHYGVKGRSGKEGAGMWYKNGQLTEAGYRHYYGERRQQVSGAVLPRQVGSQSDNEKNSEYYQKKRDQHANAATKAVAQHFISTVANTALTAAMLKKGGNSGKGLASFLNTVAVGVRIGSAINGTAHTVAWAYNSARKRQMDKKEKKESK